MRLLVCALLWLSLRASALCCPPVPALRRAVGGLLLVAGLAQPAAALDDVVDLNASEPAVTDRCWLDVRVGEGAARRLELGLYGGVVPRTAANFRALSMNEGEGGRGYRGSSFFRVISTFSAQGGNIGPADARSRAGRVGSAASGESFPPENFRIGHDYAGAGVLSMMREVGGARLGLQDSRFFLTLSPLASWADGKYVAFGRVLEGAQLLQDLAALEMQPPANYPITPVAIVDSGCYASE